MNSVPAPERSIFRIARGPDVPFALPEWARAEDDGTFGNRFDDPGGIVGISREHLYRVIYCATQREAAFAEVTSRFRQRPGLVDVLSRIDDDEESLAESLGGAVDPDFHDHGLLENDWLQRRRIGSTRIATERDFVVIDHADTLAHLDEALTPLLKWLGVDQLDLSSITRATPRILTQAASHLSERIRRDPVRIPPWKQLGMLGTVRGPLPTRDGFPGLSREYRLR